MSRRESIQYTMTKEALKDITNDNSAKAYKHDIKEFAVWARKNGFKSIDEINAAGRNTVIQRYRDEAVLARTSSANTEHRIISAVCKGLGVSRPRGKTDPGWDDRIITTRRTADTITRGRDPEGNRRGRAEETNTRYQRLLDLQRVSGIRRSELGRLRGRDLVTDECGYMAIMVERGKGGKKQLQRILPGDEDTVRRIFQSIGPDERVFTRQEMSNHINLHRLRAEQAKRAYEHYRSRLTSLDERKKLAAEIKTRYDMFQDKEHGRTGFYKELGKCVLDPDYTIRGANREKAVEHSLPVVYDRLALMAVSVFHLSHWRLDVTITNYMIQ